jgi:hypothetical protein
VFNPANGSTYALLPPAALAGARTQAAALGGYLASFSSAAEQSFVFAWLQSVAPNTNAWIGLDDEAVEGQFVWADGGPLNFTSWGGGEPNNQGNEDGVEIVVGPGGAPVWNDVPTFVLRQALIEIPSRPGDYSAAAVTVPGDGVYPYDSLGFVLSGVDTPCDVLASFNDGDFWFRYTAPGNGMLTVSNCPSSVRAPGGFTTVENDTVFTAWAATADPPTTALLCADDSPECSIFQSEATLQVLSGQTYYVQVASWGGGRVAGGVRFRFEGGASECADATPLQPGVNGPFTTVGETDPYLGLVGCEYTFRDVWFSYVPTANGRVSITTVTPAGATPGTLVDPNLMIYDGCGGAILSCADGNPGVPLTATIAAGAGQALRIRVAGYFGSTGTFHLTVSETHEILTIESNAGPGSLTIRNYGADSNAGYLTVLTLAPGAFPNGWFFGVDPTQTELLLQLASFSPPFVGAADAFGHSSYGPVLGLPPFTLYGVSLFFNAAGGLRAVTPPVAGQIL